MKTMFDLRRDWLRSTCCGFAAMLGTIASRAFGFWPRREGKVLLEVVFFDEPAGKHFHVYCSPELNDIEVMSLPCIPRLNEAFPDWLSGYRVTEIRTERLTEHQWDVSIGLERTPTSGDATC